MASSLCLEPLLSEMAVIRTTFETMVFFPDDEEMRTELLGMIEQARQQCSDKLAALIEEIESLETTPTQLPTDFDALRDYAIGPASEGMSGTHLNNLLRLNAFKDRPHRFELPDGLDAESARQMPGLTFFRRLLQDLHLRINDRAECVDRETFDRRVFQRYIVIMFLYYATTDPATYRPAP